MQVKKPLIVYSMLSKNKGNVNFILKIAPKLEISDNTLKHILKHK
jgi:hypothetical protein